MGGGPSPRVRNDDAGDRTPSMAKERKERGVGVGVLVERTVDCSICVRACLCNANDRWVVKETSEEVIIRNLKKAVGPWVDARGRSGG
jgi:hypothetical protein